MSAVHILIVFAHRVCNHVFFDLGFDFSSISVPNLTKIQSKKQAKKTTFFQSNFHDFGADLGPHLGAMLAHLGAMLAVLAPLGAPLGDLGRHLGSKMPPRCQMEPPRPPQTSIFINFQTFFKNFRNIFIDLNFKLKANCDSYFWHGGGFARAAHWIYLYTYTCVRIIEHDVGINISVGTSMTISPNINTSCL